MECDVAPPAMLGKSDASEEEVMRAVNWLRTEEVVRRMHAWEMQEMLKKSLG